MLSESDQHICQDFRVEVHQSNLEIYERLLYISKLFHRKTRIDQRHLQLSRFINVYARGG